jgi:signal transduction histidine kinase
MKSAARRTSDPSKKGQFERTPSGLRFRALDHWIHDHRLLCDVISSAVLAFFVFEMDISTESVGLLFAQPYRESVWGVLLCIPLIARHRWPDICAAGEIIVVILQILLGPPFMTFDAIALIALYDALVLGEQRFQVLWTICAALFPILSLFCALYTWDHGPLLQPWNGNKASRDAQRSMAFGRTSLLSLVVLSEITSLAVMAFARFRRANREQSRLIAQSNQALSSSVREKEQAARLSEHARIARDMHDMIAHTLSVIIAQADGGRFAGPTNPKLALSTMQTIERETLQSLDSMHQLLQPSDPDFSTSSSEIERELSRNLPSYVRIDRLVHEAQTVSDGQLSIHRTVIGQPPHDLEEQRGMVLYRMIEEGLSNIRKYAIPADHVVNVTIEETWPTDPTGTVHVTITDDGNGITQPSHPGYGLIGMRERLSSIGGTVTSGPLDPATGHGFVLDAQFPVSSRSKQLSESSSPSSDRRTSPTPPTSLRTHGRSSAVLTDSKTNHRTQSHTSLFEKISHWSLSHVWLIDTLCTILLVGFELFACIAIVIEEKWPAIVFQIACLIATGLPLAWRRSSAELCARISSTSLAFAIAVTPFTPVTPTLIWVMFCCCINSLIALNSVLLYSPRRTIPWVRPACAAIIVLATAAITVYGRNGTGDTTPADPDPDLRVQMMLALLWLISFTLTVALVAFLARARREKGDNLVLLQHQRSALLTERNEATTVAARRERENVYAMIHEDIHSTLQHVLHSVQKALPRLQEIAQHEHTTPAERTEIASLFVDISSAGRQALSQTRELLGVLRRNEEEKDAQHIPLAPLDSAPIMTEVHDPISKRHE